MKVHTICYYLDNVCIKRYVLGSLTTSVALLSDNQVLMLKYEQTGEVFKAFWQSGQ